MGAIKGQFKVIAVFTLVVFTLLLLSQVSRAQDAVHALQQNLFYSQYNLLRLVTDFELYRNGQGQNDVFDQLTAHLKQFRAHFDSVIAPESGLAETQRQALVQQWKDVARNLSALMVTVRQGGFIDQEIRYQYREQTSLLWRHLHAALLEQRSLTGSEKLVLLLQNSNLRYLEPQWRLAPHEEDSLGAMTDQIDTLISELPDAPDDFNRKWPLLRQTLQQDGRSMSFLVNRYSNDLVALLLVNAGKS